MTVCDLSSYIHVMSHCYLLYVMLTYWLVSSSILPLKPKIGPVWPHVGRIYLG